MLHSLHGAVLYYVRASRREMTMVAPEYSASSTYIRAGMSGTSSPVACVSPLHAKANARGSPDILKDKAKGGRTRIQAVRSLKPASIVPKLSCIDATRRSQRLSIMRELKR